MFDPIVEAAERACKPRGVSPYVGPGRYAMAGAIEALKPIREALDKCAEATRPPCDHATLFNEYEKVIDTISGLAFSKEEIDANV